MDFEILNRNQIYSGRVFNIEIVKVQLPDNQQKNYDLVNHPPAVTIIPIDKSNNILFVRQYRLGALSTLLELPAGVMEDGETPEISAEREIREEIGMAATEFKYLGKFYMAPGYSTELMHIFLASGLYDSPLEPDADEYIEISKVSKTEILEFARSGNIIDGKSLSALFLAEPYI